MQATIIDMSKPGAAEAFHMLQCYYALQIEVNTGLKYSRGSVMNIARERYGIEQRTKRGVMTQLARLLREKHNVDVSTSN